MPHKYKEERLAYEKKRNQNPERKESKKQWLLKNKEKIKEYREKYKEDGRYNTKKYKHLLRESVRRWRINNPERYQAHLAVKRAKYSGVLTKKLCEVCMSDKVEAHHEDYSRPLDVVWLCKKHHAEADVVRKSK